MLTCCCCIWPQEAMHAEAHMLVDTSYGSLLVGAAGNVAATGTRRLSCMMSNP